MNIIITFCKDTIKFAAKIQLFPFLFSADSTNKCNKISHFC